MNATAANQNPSRAPLRFLQANLPSLPLTPFGGWSQAPYWWYQTLVLLRSLTIIAALFLCELLIRRHHSLLPLICRSLKPRTNRLYVHGVPIVSDNPLVVKRVSASYRWIIRVCVVLSVCYLWDTLLVPSAIWDLRKSTDWNSVGTSCATGWDCFALHLPNSTNASQRGALSSVDGFLRVSFIWDLVNVCPYFRGNTTTTQGAPDLSERWTRDAAALCQTTGTMNFTAFVGALGTCTALSALVILVFEGITALLIRYRRRTICSSVVVINTVLVLSVVVWIIFLFWEALTSISCWVSRLTWLAIPVILWNARVLARILRTEIQLKNEARAIELQATDLGIDLAELMKVDDDVVVETANSVEQQSSRPRGTRHRAKEKAQQLYHRFRNRTSYGGVAGGIGGRSQKYSATESAVDNDDPSL